jgi:hypothetical protein
MFKTIAFDANEALLLDSALSELLSMKLSLAAKTQDPTLANAFLEQCMEIRTLRQRVRLVDFE